MEGQWNKFRKVMWDIDSEFENQSVVDDPCEQVIKKNVSNSGAYVEKSEDRETDNAHV